jgi:hypothetical protein
MEKVKFYFSIGLALILLVISYWAEWELLKLIFVKFLPWLWNSSLGRYMVLSQIGIAVFFILKTC